MAIPDLRGQSGPHVFVLDLEALDLADADRHHLARSLRLRDGDPLTVSNAQGHWRTAAFGDEIQATGPVHVMPEVAYELGIGIALTKATKPEFAVQKATELGLDTIVVFPAEHSVVRWDEAKRMRNEQRLTKVAREAAMQSRRVTIPAVHVLADLATVADRHDVVRADFGGVPTSSAQRFILVGPEGGWSKSERDRVPRAVDLGSTVLRAETAAVVAAAFLARSRDGYVPQSD